MSASAFCAPGAVALSQLADIVQNLEESVGDANPRKRAEHLKTLASLVETSFGGDAAVLGEFMRESGGVELLLECVADASPDVHQPALLVLGNLVSGAFEPGSPATKKLFNAAGGADVLLPHLLAGDWATQLYAVATVQNLAEDDEFARQLAAQGSLRVLQRLLKSPHQRIVDFAAGALKNAMDHLEPGELSAARMSALAEEKSAWTEEKTEM